ncbi:MAG: hypothetical protein AB1634_07955 [Thermodesulfobacteriota bacterium]
MNTKTLTDGTYTGATSLLDTVASLFTVKNLRTASRFALLYLIGLAIPFAGSEILIRIVMAVN